MINRKIGSMCLAMLLAIVGLGLVGCDDPIAMVERTASPTTTIGSPESRGFKKVGDTLYIYDGDIGFDTRDPMHHAIVYGEKASDRGITHSAEEIWPDRKVVYRFDVWPNSFDPVQKSKIRDGMDEIERTIPGIKFEESTAIIELRAYCLLSNTRQFERSFVLAKGKSALSVVHFGSSPTSFDKWTVVHELCHVLGLWHEQQRNDRDQYITVLQDLGKFENYVNYYYALEFENTHGTPFDFDSLMLYRYDATALKPQYEQEYGQYHLRAGQAGFEKHLSLFDIYTIKHLYGYSSSENPYPPSVTTTTTTTIKAPALFAGNFNNNSTGSELLFWNKINGGLYQADMTAVNYIQRKVSTTTWGWIPDATDAWKFVGDFDGNGHQDIGFWYGSNGNIHIGLSSGSAINWKAAQNTNWGGIVTSPDAYKFTGDFDGNGTTDIGFWYGGDGNVWLGLTQTGSGNISWKLSSNVAGYGNVPGHTATYKFTGDFDGNGTTDIGFWHSNGTIHYGLTVKGTGTMNWAGVNQNNWGGIPADPSAWKFSGDFDGDGTTDIGFWYGIDGNVYFGLNKKLGGFTWALGANFKSYGNIPGSTDTWRFTGDFDGNGTTDLGFWYGGNGDIIYCFSARNTAILNSVGVNSASAWKWVPSSPQCQKFVGDYDDDGKADIGFFSEGDGNVHALASNNGNRLWTYKGNFYSAMQN